MKRIRCLNASLIFLCICIFSIQTVTAKTLYDDFSGKYLDSSKWNQGEFVREASGGKLISKIKSSAINTFDRNSTSFQNPASINVIQCDIVVNEATLDTGTDTESFARIDGFFYNSQAAGGATGDVWAGVHIGDRGNGLEVNWEVVEFLADDLSSYDELGRDTITVPGLAYGNTYTVKLEYDGANGFTFTVAGESAIFNTGPARQRDAVTPHKGLTVGAYSNGGSGSGFVSASFDNVQINKATYDDFFTAPLDQTKWQSQEFVREIDNGKVQLISHSTGDRKNTNLSFSEIPPYVEATVRIDSSSVIDPGDRGIARIDGFFTMIHMDLAAVLITTVTKAMFGWDFI